MTHQIIIDESQRQVVLMALAHLAVERPGWDSMLNGIALQIDREQTNGSAEMFTYLKQIHLARQKEKV